MQTQVVASPVSSRIRMPQLDGIRGVAVSLVVLFHFFGGNDNQSIVNAKGIRWFFNQGWSGVDLFFILSGFLIGGIFLDNRVDLEFIKTFFWRRFLRIFPLYYVLVVIVFLGSSQPVGGGQIWLYLAYLQNIIPALGYAVPDWLGATWSLAVEEHFYLLLPGLFLCAPRHRFGLVLGVLIGCAILSRVLFCLIELPLFAYFFTLCRADDLLFGVALAYLARKPEVVAAAARRMRIAYGVAGACVLVLPVISFLRLKYPAFHLMFGMSVYSALYLAVMVIVVVGPESLLARVMRLRVLRWLGSRAYAIYLFHMIALSGGIWFGERAGFLSPYPSRFIGLVLILVIAALTWWALEKPLIGFGHRRPYRSAASMRAHASLEPSA